MDGLGIAGPLRNGTNRTLDRPGVILSIALANIAQGMITQMMPPIPGDPGYIRSSLLQGVFETWKVNIINS